MKQSNLLPLLLFATTTFADMSDLKFSEYGKDIGSHSHAQLAIMVRPQEVRIFEPHLVEEQTYRGFKLKDLLDKVFSDRWTKAEEVLLQCSDGYKASVPVSQVKKYDAYLSYEIVGRKSFEFINKIHGNELTSLGPYYLIWDNLKHPELKAEGARGWPYQITALGLINFSDQFPKLTPGKATMNEHQKRGFLAYRQHCMSCHTLNGEGGDMSGIELNYPESVTTYWQPDWLVKWMLGPNSIRLNSKMPPMTGGPTDANKNAARDIAAYLKLMAAHKQKP